MRRHLAVDDDDGHGAMGDSIDDNCDSAMNINNDGDGATDDDIDDNDCVGQATMMKLISTARRRMTLTTTIVTARWMATTTTTKTMA